MEIFLNDIRLRAWHGCLPQERVTGGDYGVDVWLRLPDDERAICRDELEGTVDYAVLYTIVKEEMAVPSNLLEHVCGRILRHIEKGFPRVEEASVTIRKLCPPILGADCGGAGVTLRWTRHHL